jgi:cell division protein FtsX
MTPLNQTATVPARRSNLSSAIFCDLSGAAWTEPTLKVTINSSNVAKLDAALMVLVLMGLVLKALVLKALVLKIMS